MVKVVNQILNQRRKGRYMLCDSCNKLITNENEFVKVKYYTKYRQIKIIKSYHIDCYEERHLSTFDKSNIKSNK